MNSILTQPVTWSLEDFNQSGTEQSNEVETTDEAEPIVELADYTIINAWNDGYMQAGRHDQAVRPNGGQDAAFLQALQDVETQLRVSADHASAHVVRLLVTAFASFGIEKQRSDTAGCIRDLAQAVRPALDGAVPMITVRAADGGSAVLPTAACQQILDGAAMCLPVADGIAVSWRLGRAEVDWRQTMQEMTSALAPLVWGVMGEENPPITEQK